MALMFYLYKIQAFNKAKQHQSLRSLDSKTRRYGRKRRLYGVAGNKTARKRLLIKG
jgi:hypothetical protein